ncbi:MAG: four helix bundle protein [Planctomycetes bacterium RBG_13_63_9]|nr:MAG: four helix bundle protein [Planctomycetes bacterium RBG_13_63_9]
MAGRNYRDLIAWQKAMDPVMLVYQASEDFPKQETYGLTSQIRRAAVSIPSNIAEGQGRRTRRDFRRFLSIAVGSVREVETQTLIASRLGYIGEETAQAILDQATQVCRLTTALANSLARNQ